MNERFKLEDQKSALLVIDVQEKLFPHVDRPCDMMERMQLLVEGIGLLSLPTIVTEQYPQGLGGTIVPLKERLGE